MSAPDAPILFVTPTAKLLRETPLQERSRLALESLAQMVVRYKAHNDRLEAAQKAGLVWSVPRDES